MGQWTCIEKEISENNALYKRKEIILDEVFRPETASTSVISSDDLKVSHHLVYFKQYKIHELKDLNSRSDFLVMRDQMPFNRNLGPLTCTHQ